MSENPEADPPRYTRNQWGHQLLVTDEREWLARPDTWAIWDHGGQRKHDLFFFHMAEQFGQAFNCPICKPLVWQVITEQGACVPDDFPSWPHFRTWYQSTHGETRCGAHDVVWNAAMYKRGVTTAQELWNKVFEAVVQAAHLQSRGTAEKVRSRQEWDRFITFELVGPNPFRPVAFAPEWRTPTAVGLARSLYESRDFGPMPVLADALEEAGCDAADVLAHCRGPGPHVRGCWVVDLLLGLA